MPRAATGIGPRTPRGGRLEEVSPPAPRAPVGSDDARAGPGPRVAAAPRRGLGLRRRRRRRLLSAHGPAGVAATALSRRALAAAMTASRVSSGDVPASLAALRAVSTAA